MYASLPDVAACINHYKREKIFRDEEADSRDSVRPINGILRL